LPCDGRLQSLRGLHTRSSTYHELGGGGNSPPILRAAGRVLTASYHGRRQERVCRAAHIPNVFKQVSGLHRWSGSTPLRAVGVARKRSYQPPPNPPWHSNHHRPPPAGQRRRSHRTTYAAAFGQRAAPLEWCTPFCAPLVWCAGVVFSHHRHSHHGAAPNISTCGSAPAVVTAQHTYLSHRTMSPRMVCALRRWSGTPPVFSTATCQRRFSGVMDVADSGRRLFVVRICGLEGLLSDIVSILGLTYVVRFFAV